MFKNIHRRLTIFSTIVSGIILTFVIGLILIVRTDENRKSEIERIKNSWIPILSSLQSGNQFDDIRLAQMEARNYLLIHIEENGHPLLFSGSWTPKTDRGILLDRVKDIAREEGLNPYFSSMSSYGSQTHAMEIEGDFKDSYYALITVFPAENGLRSIYLISYRNQMNSGAWFYFLMVLYLCGLCGLWGTSHYFIGKALQPARESEERQKRFIAAASHELRAPLAVINSTLFLLNDDTPEQKQWIHHIDTECRHMSRLIGDMLFLYTADSKTWNLKLETLELDSVVIDVYGSFLSLCRQNRIQLKLELPEEPTAPIEGDRQRLEQVLAILIDNAISYSSPDTEIMIQLYPRLEHKAFPSELIIIEVIDQGRGIPDELKPHIFERFYCADHSHGDKEHFGLGLSIAKEIIEMHKGRIQVKDHLPQGSRFIISLPVTGDLK